MFGISFSELLLVGLVALLVLGPERLPGAARTAGLWVGRLKRSFNAIKQEVERELGADEIRRQLHNEHILQLERDAQKLMAPLTGQQPPAESDATAPASPPAPPTIAPNSRLANIPGVGIPAAAEAPAAPAAPEAPAAPAAAPPPETPRTP
ncbi:Sec-independent protein translocase protein TatB [Pseudomonas citronellolis]|uniref:Sec-independent protein translocase protein TatB n=1 Tax=Pseudomonas citronellolis TaxID=53408 RepID=UPI0023E454CD|nr:Sec-independent protein translocase protein TatB [Pseudomonas citronellolis]MDF3935133.1 Sec-independent protein translocase protein TatB [Pseudomonas citronellolis]